MNYLKKIIPLLVLLPFLFTACSDDPTSLGNNLLNQGNIILSKIDSYTDSLGQKFEPHQAKLSLGSSDVLLVGKDSNVESQILLAFSMAIADKYLTNFDSLTFVSADISLTRNYYYGDTLQPFNVGIHQITSTWNSLFTVDSLSKVTYNPAPVVQPTMSGNVYTFAADINLVKEWFKAAKDTSLAKNFGILIKPTGTSRFTGFAASTSLNSDVPAIKIVVKKSTAYETYQDTLTFNGSVDVHIIQGMFPEAAGGKTLTIQNGTGIQGKLWFDLSKLPTDAVVNTAKLTLSIDTLNMKVGSSYSDGMVAFQIADSVSDSTNASFVISLPRSGNTYTGDVARIINNAILTKNNYGMLITSTYQIHGIENFALFNSSAANNEFKPRLTIMYSQIKK